MRGSDFLNKMELVDPTYIEAAEAAQKHKLRTGRRRLPAILAAAIIVILLMGVGVCIHTVMSGDLWIEQPSNDPVRSVQQAIENQIGKDYTVRIEIESVEVDEAETQRVIERFISGTIADRRGWSDEYLANHFIVVKAVYYAEYDSTKTTRSDGNIVQYFYLTRDVNSGEWTIVDNSGNLNWSQQGDDDREEPSDTSQDSEDSDNNPDTVPSIKDQLFVYLSELFNSVYSQYYDGLHYEFTYYNETITGDTVVIEFFWAQHFLGKGWDVESDEGVEQTSNWSLQATVTINADGTLDFNSIAIFGDSSTKGPPVYDIPLDSLFPDQLR